MLNSRARFEEDLELRESAQFLLPAVSRKAVVDPRREPAFTLNQFNVVIATGASDRELSQIHFYPYNPAVDAALPGVLRARLARPLTTSLLRRLSVGFGYLPSWASPRLRLRATRAAEPDQLPRLSVSGERVRATRSPMFRAVVRRLLRAAPYLDLWPALPATYFAGPGKSYHFGGTFPHRADADAERFSSDRLGRVAGWERVHVVDGAVLPSVAATTFTLTVMANAHRIASATREPERP
jgi:choline dehydrogenase-like flavoprotein